MKKLRGFLIVVMAVCICMGVAGFSDIAEASSTTVSLSSVTVKPGNTVMWYPTDDTSGFVLTNGASQSMKLYFGEIGNKIGMGFMKYDTSKRFVWYKGTLTSASTSKVTKTLTGATAYYRPYLKNRNATVYITVNSGSYVVIK